MWSSDCCGPPPPKQSPEILIAVVVTLQSDWCGHHSTNIQKFGLLWQSLYKRSEVLIRSVISPQTIRHFDFCGRRSTIKKDPTVVAITPNKRSEALRVLWSVSPCNFKSNWANQRVGSSESLRRSWLQSWNITTESTVDRRTWKCYNHCPGKLTISNCIITYLSIV